MRRLGAAAIWSAGICPASMAAIGMLAFGAAAMAAEDQRSYPYITGEVEFEIENDGTYHSEDPTEEFYDLSTQFEPIVVVHLAKGLTAVAHATLEESSSTWPRA
jgi:hypothetical protein